MAFFECNLLEEDVTIQDLETLKKIELDDLIKNYGQRRRFGRILVQWMLTRNLSIDPELLMIHILFLSVLFFNLLSLLSYIIYSSSSF